MEIDSGACKSAIHIEDYNKILSHLKLELVNFKLKVVTGEKVVIIGQVLVKVVHNGTKFKLPLIVLSSKTKFIPLLGRNWLNSFNPNWRNIINAQVMFTKVKNKIVKSVNYLQNEVNTKRTN